MFHSASKHWKPAVASVLRYLESYNFTAAQRPGRTGTPIKQFCSFFVERGMFQTTEVLTGFTQPLGSVPQCCLALRSPLTAALSLSLDRVLISKCWSPVLRPQLPESWMAGYACAGSRNCSAPLCSRRLCLFISFL